MGTVEKKCQRRDEQHRNAVLNPCVCKLHLYTHLPDDNNNNIQFLNIDKFKLPSQPPPTYTHTHTENKEINVLEIV